MTRCCQSIVKDHLLGITLEVFSDLKLLVVHGQGLKRSSLSMKFPAFEHIQDLIYPKQNFTSPLTNSHSENKHWFSYTYTTLSSFEVFVGFFFVLGYFCMVGFFFPEIVFVCIFKRHQQM